MRPSYGRSMPLGPTPSHDRPAAPPIDDEALIDLARGLASTSSVSGNEEAAIRLVAGARGARVRRGRVDDVGNVVGIMGTGDGPRLLIDGHIDSIPLHSEDRWTVDPFGGSIIDGKLYGLGICDQKASIAAAAHGVGAERARGAFDGRVAVVASVCEEEMEGCALASAIDSFQPDFVITSEPNDTRLGIGQRGRAEDLGRVAGRACHAGHAGVGLNAAEALAALIVEAGSSSTRPTPTSASATSRASTSRRGRTRRCRPCRGGPRPGSTAASSRVRPRRRSSRCSRAAPSGRGPTGPSSPGSRWGWSRRVQDLERHRAVGPRVRGGVVDRRGLALVPPHGGPGRRRPRPDADALLASARTAR